MQQKAKIMRPPVQIRQRIKRKQPLSAATAAASSQNAALSAQTAAETAKSQAEAAQSAAEAAQSAAETAQEAAEAAKTSAQSSQQAAALNATDAADSASAAQTARTAAQSAQQAAESAKTAAETAKTGAETAAGQAQSSATAAAGSATTASQKADDAADSAAAAEQSSQSAAGSATSASQSAGTATAQATAASQSAQDAAGSATAASQSASSASTSATNAANDASAAAQSATDAESSAASAATSASEAASAAANAVAGKADKVTPSTAGNVALLASDGNLQDSGKQFTPAGIGAAPDGYGLGTTTGMDVPTNESGRKDLNLATNNGWYYIYFSENYDNFPGTSEGGPGSGYHAMRVDTFRGITQTIYMSYQNWAGCIAIRHQYYANSAWSNWCWVNPLMLVGVQYRTLENFNNKPVYKIAISCGAMPSANSTKTVSHGISNIEAIVSYGGYMTAGGNTSLSIPFRNSATNYGDISVDYAKITLVAGATSLSAYTESTVWFAYTLTTD